MMVSEKELIRGKVARIINTRELVLNIGSDDGVLEEMLFEVLDPKGEDIYDPDTGELLGSIDKPKIRVKATHVQNRLTLAKTYMKNRVNIGGTGSDMSIIRTALMPPRWIEEYETFKTDEKTLIHFDEKESLVKTGDPVKEIRS